MPIIIQENDFYRFFKKYITWESGTLHLKKTSFIDRFLFKIYIIMFLRFGKDNTRLIVTIHNETNPGMTFEGSKNNDLFMTENFFKYYDNAKITLFDCMKSVQTKNDNLCFFREVERKGCVIYYGGEIYAYDTL